MCIRDRLKDGECVFERAVKTSVPPLGEKYIPLAWPETADSGEYVYEVSARLDERTLWAEPGYEVAFGQKAVKKEAKAEAGSAGSGLQVIHGDVNLGVRGKDFSVIFSRPEGGIASLIYGGTEYITRAPKLTFWRASTDNEDVYKRQDPGLGGRPRILYAGRAGAGIPPGMHGVSDGGLYDLHIRRGRRAGVLYLSLIHI